MKLLCIEVIIISVAAVELIYLQKKNTIAATYTIPAQE